MVKCYVCMGSNYEREGNLSFARRELSMHFHDITFAPTDDTVPIHLHNRAHFLNQVACLSTSMTRDEVVAFFKSVERAAGRCPEDKAHEIVRLDIDLLTYGDAVIKPDDLKRDYVVRGIASLQC